MPMFKEFLPLPPRFADLKREIAASYPDFEAQSIRSWAEILRELSQVTKIIAEERSEYIPQAKFSELEKLSIEEIQTIKRRGCVVIKDIIDDPEAVAYKQALEEMIKVNPDIEGSPKDKSVFYELYWSKAQIQARGHPNFLKVSLWLNNLYHADPDRKHDVDLATPLTYADRIRIRQPGPFDFLPAHVDGGTIERWEDPNFRKCFEDILSGNWRQHDPYDIGHRVDAHTDLYGRPNQASVLRTFQGWLSLSETGPKEGTLQVFPDVLLSNAYIILRPFFRPTVPVNSPEIWDANNWEFDTSDPDFPGIHPLDGGYYGPRPSPALHPNLQLDRCMTSMPKVYPGDAVFWHSDVIHAVEEQHTGKGDAAVMFIPAVPLTPQNQAYIERQRESFLIGKRPPDFPQGGKPESEFVGTAVEGDIEGPVARRAMGFVAVEV